MVHVNAHAVGPYPYGNLGKVGSWGNSNWRRAMVEGVPIGMRIICNNQFKIINNMGLQ